MECVLHVRKGKGKGGKRRSQDIEKFKALGVREVQGRGGKYTSDTATATRHAKILGGLCDWRCRGLSCYCLELRILALQGCICLIWTVPSLLSEYLPIPKTKC
jgi:hypothetical protein